jgi:hypothetical protein
MLFSNFLLAVADVFHTFSGMCMSVQQEFIRRRIYSPEEFIRQEFIRQKNLFARRDWYFGDAAFYGLEVSWRCL